MTEIYRVELSKIPERLDRIRDRIVRACQRVGRDESSVTLIGVTKTFSSDFVSAGFEAGLMDFGENKAQELIEKSSVYPGTSSGGNIRWHMIGHLQRNKVKAVLDSADYFHALDSLRLASEIDKRAAQSNRILPCLVQVNVSGEDTKYGLNPGNTPPFLDELVQFQHLKVIGLMTLASPAVDEKVLRIEFGRLRNLVDSYKSPDTARIQLECLSMGMSGDFEIAIEEGATHVRIGSAIFGERQ